MMVERATLVQLRPFLLDGYTLLQDRLNTLKTEHKVAKPNAKV